MILVELELEKNDVNILVLMVSKVIDSLNGFLMDQTYLFIIAAEKKSGLSWMSCLFFYVCVF